jgi:uncharacterized protein (TIGR02265 family)
MSERVARGSVPSDLTSTSSDWVAGTSERLSIAPERSALLSERVQERAVVANSNSIRPSVRPSSPSVPSAITATAHDPWQEYAARIPEAPESGTVRGLYFTEIMRLVPSMRGNSRRRFVPFSKYPLREYMQLLIDAGRAAHPTKVPAQALQALGLTTFSAFSSSISGMSLLSSVGVDIERVLELVPKAYPLTVQPGRVEIVSRSAGEAVVQLRELWTYPESYHVGVWLGAMDILGIEGKIEVIRHGWCNVDFHVRWSRKER